MSEWSPVIRHPLVPSPFTCGEPCHPELPLPLLNHRKYINSRSNVINPSLFAFTDHLLWPSTVFTTCYLLSRFASDFKNVRPRSSSRTLRVPGNGKVPNHSSNNTCVP